MTDAPPNQIIELSKQFKRALDKNDKAALNRLIDAYGRIYEKLQDKIQLLENLIEMENPTAGQLVRREQYKALIAQVEDELTKYQTILADTIDATSRDAINFAARDTSRLLRAIGSEYGVDVTFARLPTEAVKTLLGFLAEDGPLFQRISELAPFTATKVAETIVDSVALGKGPREIARLIRDDLGGGLTDALRMTRTVQLWSYREATRANYAANSDIVEGWYWYAALDQEPCMACIAEHGTFHGLDETLDDHHNGRCTMLPAIQGFPNPVEQSGEEWFEGLGEAEQKKLMGPEFYDAWKGGAFELSQMAHKVEDAVYGNMTSTTPLWDLLGAEPPTTK